MKMKSALTSSIFNDWEKIDKNVIVFTIDDMVHGTLKTM
jgi:CDP-glycerol glycerophosphotransferase (TagB/SpsB family)